MNWKSQANRNRAIENGLIEIPQAFAGGGELITARLASDKTQQQLQRKSSQQPIW